MPIVGPPIGVAGAEWASATNDAVNASTRIADFIGLLPFDGQGFARRKGRSAECAENPGGGRRRAKRAALFRLRDSHGAARSTIRESYYKASRRIAEAIRT